ncbi:PREDICTED: phosphoenolpyruvate carboxylase kinase 1-like [Ipomoea nil]|uniref:phosphoenolpyruvate carboxylase kinase 1-like n=1 Tax=Ipomoea nil TaxID=35883 RepID=UPI0009008CA9|nr:PREDICTED: phosphoenolpyruvate carboxylase kinase 1-like [Ipomoea nil]
MAVVTRKSRRGHQTNHQSTKPLQTKAKSKTKTTMKLTPKSKTSSDLFKRLSEAEALVVMVLLMEEIAHCHRLGVAHWDCNTPSTKRDIKPDSVLFNEWDELKLADFGSTESELMSGVVGTPYYVAPKVLAGRDYLEVETGAILYIMLAGVLPFYGDSAEEKSQSQVSGEDFQLCIASG